MRAACPVVLRAHECSSPHDTWREGLGLGRELEQGYLEDRGPEGPRCDKCTKHIRVMFKGNAGHERARGSLPRTLRTLIRGPG